MNVPEGFKLVPVELTEDMHAAAVRTISRCSGNADFPPRVYTAMLAAAPTPPALTEAQKMMKDAGDDDTDYQTGYEMGYAAGERETKHRMSADPTPAMLVAAREWSIKTYPGSAGIEDRDALGVWKAMQAARVASSRPDNAPVDNLRATTIDEQIQRARDEMATWSAGKRAVYGLYTPSDEGKTA